MSTPHSGAPSAKGKEKEKEKEMAMIFEEEEKNLLSSRFPEVATRAYINLMPKASIGKPHDPNSPSILDAQPPVPNTPLRWAPSTADRSPDNPFRDERKVLMFNAFDVRGPAGLAEHLYDECERMKREMKWPSATWDTMLKDRDNGTYAATKLLSLLTPEVTKSLIKGTFPHDVHADPTIKSFYWANMRPEEFPGIYMNALTGAKTKMTATHPITHAVKYLSPNAINGLCTKYTSYINGTDIGLRNAIDGTFGQSLQAGPPKWANTDIECQTGQDWIKKVRELYCDNVDPNDMDKSHISGPFEVGWSVNVKTRLVEYKENASTTNIFGFNNALTRLPLGQGGLGAAAPPFTALLFPIWDQDQHLARVGEILGSMLLGSYWFQGGFNCTYAGTFDLPSNIDFDGAKERTMSMLEWCKAPDLLVANALELRKKLHQYKSPAGTQEELDKVKERVRAANDRLREQDEEYERLKEELLEVSTRMHKIQDEAFEAWDARENLPADQQGIGALLKGAADEFESSRRVEEEVRRQTLSEVMGLPNRPGPAVVQRPLTDEEEARVQKKVDQFNVNVDNDWQEYVRWRDNGRGPIPDVYPE
ncbi:MAG: hypothetical protein Q9186_002164 [Xanthomendoza sp. 1 TL-2023]